jgi:hypothetical protein
MYVPNYLQTILRFSCSDPFSAYLHSCDLSPKSSIYFSKYFQEFFRNHSIDPRGKKSAQISLLHSYQYFPFDYTNGYVDVSRIDLSFVSSRGGKVGVADPKLSK